VNRRPGQFPADPHAAGNESRFTRFLVSGDNFELADGKRERVRKVSPVQTRRGAEEFERQIRQALLDGSYSSPPRR
jgi:hypothetical protein